MNKENKILLLSNIILVGFFLAVVFHYILGFYLGLQAPFNSFLFPAYKAFCDFMELLPHISDFAPYKEVSVWIAYFPLTYILLFPFTLIKNYFISYILFVSGFLSFFTYMNIKMFFCSSFSKLQNFQNIFILTLMSYPFLYALDKGNFDLFLFVVLALAVYSFKAENYWLSAILFAIENAIKPFPILFLFLFLYKRRFKEFFLSLILSVLLIITGFMILKGNFFDQILIYVKDLAPFREMHVYYNDNNFGLEFTSSLFFLVKWLFCKVSSHPLLSTRTLAHFYDIWINLMIGVTLFFTWREKVFWKQIALMTIFMLSVPYLIYDHKLIFLFIPIWLFINAEDKSKFDMIYTILFGLLCIPKNLIFVNSAAFKDPNLLYFLIVDPNDFLIHNIHWAHISLSVILNPLIMLLIMGLIIYEQFNFSRKSKG